MEMQPEWVMLWAWKQPETPDTKHGFASEKKGGLVLVLDFAGMIIHSFEGNHIFKRTQIPTMFRISNPENWKLRETFKIHKKCPKATQLSSRSKRRNACCFWNAASRSRFSCKLLTWHGGRGNLDLVALDPMDLRCFSRLESGMQFWVSELLLRAPIQSVECRWASLKSFNMSSSIRL